jgi:chorismate mutase
MTRRSNAHGKKTGEVTQALKESADAIAREVGTNSHDLQQVVLAVTELRNSNVKLQLRVIS